MGNIWINNKKYTIDNQSLKDKKIIDILSEYKINLGLCYDKKTNNCLKCGLCSIKVNDKICLACNSYAKDGDKIITDDPLLNNIRINNLKNLSKSHNFNCQTCSRNSNCSLLKMLNQYQITDNNLIKPIIDNNSSTLTFDHSKCIGCSKCVSACNTYSIGNCLKLKEMKINNQKVNRVVHEQKNIDNTKCILCGQCTLVCPTNGVSEHSYIEDVKKILADKNNYVICAIAPSVRASINEHFTKNNIANPIKKIYSVLKQLGFNKVYDLNYGADLTIVEEANELLNRLNIKTIDKINNNLSINKSDHQLPLPMFTSCCPGWVRLVKGLYPNLVNNLSTTKSPQEIFASSARLYLPKINNLDNKKLKIVMIMPCTAKKYEAKNNKDVDYVLTTREFVNWIEQAKINWNSIKESEVDKLMGQYSTSGAIFGNTGGVMEASLRTTYYYATGKNLIDIKYNELTNLNSIKTATIDINGKKINVAVVNGAKNIINFLNNKEYKKYDFIEMMACPGGCINGGGQLINPDPNKIQIRSKLLLNIENSKKVNHFSHENNELLEMYQKLGFNIGDKNALKHFHHKSNK